MAKSLATLVLLTWLPLILSSQALDSTQYQAAFEIEDIAFFTLDPLQNIFAVSNKGILTKYSPKGTPLFTYENTSLGTLSHIDANDPFNILLFFQDQQRILLVDRTLSLRSQLDLLDTPIQQASAIATSFDNNIWIYDTYEGRLLQMDAQSNIGIQSNDLRFNENIHEAAQHIWVKKDKIFVNFPSRGIAIFDLNAQLQAWWDIKGVLDAQLIHNGFAYRTAAGVFVFSPHSGITEPMLVKTQEPRQVRQNAAAFYVLDQGGRLKVFFY